MSEAAGAITAFKATGRPREALAWCVERTAAAGLRSIILKIHAAQLICYNNLIEENIVQCLQRSNDVPSAVILGTAGQSSGAFRP
jgi:hypothetical protein